VVDFDYDHANRRTKLTYPSGTSTEYAYDSASRLTGLTYTHGGNTLGALTYAYDAASQRTQVGGSWARTGLPAALASATYNAANHQTAVGGQALTYDLNGNLTGDGTNTYTWNARNQLASISGPIAGSFVYDAFGRRQRTTVDGVITDVVYDGLNPVRQAVGATTVNLLTGLGIDEYLTRTDASSARDLLSDALGTTVGLGDGAGAVTTEYSYEPFGAVTASGSSSSNEFRYTGREDDGTGIYYYRARYYHPQLQRFISEDPIGFQSADPNFYAYVSNSPLSFLDPLGLDKTNGCKSSPTASRVYFTGLQFSGFLGGLGGNDAGNKGFGKEITYGVGWEAWTWNFRRFKSVGVARAEDFPADRVSGINASIGLVLPLSHINGNFSDFEGEATEESIALGPQYTRIETSGGRTGHAGSVGPGLALSLTRLRTLTTFPGCSR
jgi:RHS repeat-associated protein